MTIRPLETIILAVGFVVLASAARACGECEPPPPPEPPKVERPERSDPLPQVSLPLPCCILPNGTVEFKAPLPSMKAKTKRVCERAIEDEAEMRPCTRQGIW